MSTNSSSNNNGKGENVIQADAVEEESERVIEEGNNNNLMGDRVGVPQQYHDPTGGIEFGASTNNNANQADRANQATHTFFYDGVTNFKRKSDSMYPLLVSVSNCNPSDRAKLGCGLFLAALHNVKPKSLDAKE
jgi:hypothetical protein